MTTEPLRFYGNSDDTFGEYGRTKDDYDNCASGKPIEWEVLDAFGNGVLVSGTYSDKDNGAWSISVTPWHGTPTNDDLTMPEWPMRFEQATDDDCPYSPVLVIEAPENVRIRCRQRSEDDGA